MSLHLHIESLIFASDEAISLPEIKHALEASFQQTFKREDILDVIDHLTEKYQGAEFSFELVQIAEGFQFLTKGAYFNTISHYLKLVSRKKLSKVALETLSIIAYKQPVAKSELEAIRGVNCDYSLQKLLDKELVEIVGRSEGPGRPILYGTSQKFMQYFGLKDLRDLPQPKDFKQPESEIGEPAPIEENINENDGPGSDSDSTFD